MMCQILIGWKPYSAAASTLPLSQVWKCFKQSFCILQWLLLKLILQKRQILRLMLLRLPRL
ncbi:unnamed protein product, partial [Vitis vinifera]